MNIPRIIISGLSGGTGKTLVSLGITRALTLAGCTIKTFKKGPDYIDAAWLAHAAQTNMGNLDPYFSSPCCIRQLFAHGAAQHDMAIVEGNRGLFDGMDVKGTCSTAELSRILATPILLVVDCTKMTRTAAALVAGCKSFEPGITIGGVILNKTGTERQRTLIRNAIEELVQIPVVGALPRNFSLALEERHLGLTGINGNSQSIQQLDALAEFIGKHVNLDQVKNIANSAPAFMADCMCHNATNASTPPSLDTTSIVTATEPTLPHLACVKNYLATPIKPQESVTIGYVNDACFYFYYQENLTALCKEGATLIPVSVLDTTPWPKLDGLYIGGGVPEEHAEALAANTCIRNYIKDMADNNLPIYAEGAAVSYLCDEVYIKEKMYTMTGIFHAHMQMESRPQGLGYMQATVDGVTPYHPQHTMLRAHEFTFWRYVPKKSSEYSFAFTVHKGTGLKKVNGQQRDGMLYRNTFASMAQLYAPAAPYWAQAFVDACLANKQPLL